MWTPKWLRKERAQLKESIEEAERLQEELDSKEEYVDQKYIEFSARLRKNEFERALRQALRGGRLQ